MYIFVSPQPVFKMETYEEDMEIAEVNQGFVHLQVICYIFFAADKSLNVQTRSQSALVICRTSVLHCRPQSRSSLLTVGTLARSTSGCGEI